MKGVFRFILGVVLAVLLCGSTPVAAADYTITITDSKTGKNQQLVFEESNIGPGFAQSYPIQVNNQSSSPVQISLYDITENPTNTMTLSDLNMTFSYNGTVLIDNQSGNGLNGADFICLGPHTDDLFTLHLGFDSGRGNAYQGTVHEVELTFRAGAATCRGTSPGAVDPPKEEGDDSEKIKPPLLPNTGESRAFYYFLAGLILVFGLMTVASLIWFIVARRRRDDERRRR